MIPMLSEREIEICKLLGAGLNVTGVARRLKISPYTVNCHIGRIFKKVKPFLTDKKVLKTRKGELHPRIIVLSRYAWELEKPEVIFEEDQTLTPRQKEISALLASGYSVKRLAHTLGIAPNTAEVHLYRAANALSNYLSKKSRGITKNSSHRRIHFLVRYAFDRGLAKPIFKI